jgi:zinc protease
MPPFEAPAPRARVVILDKPDAGRTAITIGRIGIARRAPEYVAGVVATAVLSGYSGRLNQEVRVKRGLSYGAGAQLLARRSPGMVLASTLVDHARVAEATDVILATLGGLGAEAPPESELVTRKATVTGSFSRSIETIDGIAGVLGELALYGVPLSDLGAYMPNVEAIAPDDVRDFVATYVARDPFVVLVGDAQRFVHAIRLAHADVTVIPAAELDLNRATLVR